jgi:ferritin-like protein
VGIESIENSIVAGADLTKNKILSLLNQNMAKEITANQLYKILSIYLEELNNYSMIETIDVACAMDRRHFKSLLQYYQHISGKFPDCINEFDVNLNDPTSILPNAKLNLKEAFEKMIEVKQSSVLGYTRLCNLIFYRDRKTYLLVLGILNEELELKTWFSQFVDAKYPEIAINISIL